MSYNNTHRNKVRKDEEHGLGKRVLMIVNTFSIGKKRMQKNETDVRAYRFKIL